MRELSGVASGLVSLPSGGGGVSPLGERFQPDLVRGSGSYAVPLNLPKGPNELKPSLTLTYSTGSGSGAYGLGWRLNVMHIERRTDRGIPTYTDDDTFVIGDTEVLVPVGGNRYRPKADTKFWDIIRTKNHWRVRTGDGRTLFFGQTAASRESDGPKIFAWHVNEERDAAGNRIRFRYRRNGNRLYLREVRYSIFRLRFIYERRPDLQRSGRSGFLRLLALRLRRIELHCNRQTPTLIRTYTLHYKQAANGTSLLARLSVTAHQDGETARFPDLNLSTHNPTLNAGRYMSYRPS